MAASNGTEYFELEMEAGRESFGRVSNADFVEDDEEELLWAALARLPSQKRGNFALIRRNASERRRGNIDDETIADRVVDVRKLDRMERELVVNKAFATNEQDNFKLLSAVKERLDR